MSMHRRIGIGSVVVITILFGGLAYTQWFQQPEMETVETPRIIEATIEIEGVLPAHRVEITEGTTALEMLRAESAEEGFMMREKEYAGLGILVERLGDSENGEGGKYWTYTVNGTFAPVGADVYKPKTGDMIEWTFDVPTTSY